MSMYSTRSKSRNVGQEERLHQEDSMRPQETRSRSYEEDIVQEMDRRRRDTLTPSLKSLSHLATDSGIATSRLNVQSPSTSNRLGNPEAIVPEIPLVGGRVHDHSTGRTAEAESTPTESTMRVLAPPPLHPAVAANSVSSRSSRAQRQAARRRIEYETELELFKTQQRLAQMKKAMKLAELEAEEELEDDRPIQDRQALVGEWVDKSPFNAVEETPHRPDIELPRRQAMEQAPTAEGRRDTSKERRLPGKAIEDLAAALQSMAKSRPTPRAFYELPNFYGDPADWLLFKRRYEHSSTMYEFKPSENLSRIQMAIHGKAKELIEDLLRTSTDPNEIIRVLDSTYGNPYTLLQCAMKKVRSLPNVNDNDSEALRSFSSAVRSCVSTLKNIKADGYLNNPQLVRELLDKLTPSQRTEYSKFARQVSLKSNVDLRVSPTLTVLVEFLEELADTAAFMVSADMSGTVTKPNPPKPTTNRQPANPLNNRQPRVVHKVMEVSEKESAPSCELCQGEHQLPSCDEFKKMEPEKRWDFVKKTKLCFKCLVKKHNRLSCRSKKCVKCNFNHHQLLHVTNPSSNESSKPPQTERVTNLGDQRMKSLLKVVPVTVKDGSIERHTYALLDDGATVSLIDSSMAINMNGPKIPLHIISAGGHSVIDQDSRNVKVVLRGPMMIDDNVNNN